MIISRTPFRISFFGGGTDYPAWYRKHGGAVLATTIDKYCYLTCRYLPPFFEHKIKVAYAKIETCHSIGEIQHPSVREVLYFLKIRNGVEIHHVSDLPARSGMGSSSSFTVGLLNALHALKGHMPSKKQLAMESIYIEQEKLGETVGSQDQASAAYGGFNYIQLFQNGEISVRPITVSAERVKELNAHLMLFYTGIKRTASDVAASFVPNIEDKKRQLRIMKDLVDEGLAVLSNGEKIGVFGELLHEAWLAKRSLSPVISNATVDEIYELAKSKGALGGKITGAGGGGFVLLCVPPAKQKGIKEALKKLIHVPFSFDFTGSQIIHYDFENDYSAVEKDRVGRPKVVFRELN